MPEVATPVLQTRDQYAAYMKVGSTPAYELIGEGFTSLSESKNPKEYTRKYVSNKTEKTDVIGYAPSIAYTCDAVVGDPVVDEIIKITDEEKTGADAQVDIVTANLWEAGTTTGTVVAYHRKYSVIPDGKGDGTDALVYSGTLKAVTDLEKGIFTLATKEFVADE